MNPSPESRVKPFDPDLRERLREFQQAYGLSNTQLALKLDCHATQVSKYLNGRPEGNVARFESIVIDVLKNAARRSATKIKHFTTNVSRTINGDLQTIRKTNDLALITGPAGIGKTCGFEIYVADNPATIFITASAWHAARNGFEALFFDSFNTSDWDGCSKRANYLTDKLKNSDRLIIIDNAHRLKRSALQWIFDFHDATGCPVALGGNPEVLDLIRKNDQMFSRVGLHRDLTKLTDTQHLVQNVVEQIWPEANGDLNDLGAVVVEHQGAVRALRKQVSLAKELSDNNPKLRDPQIAFKAAHTQLIRDYQLK